MATVSKWTPFGVALDITATAATVTRTSATQYTVKINVAWETYYSGAQTNYGMTAASGGVTYTISAFNGAKRSSGSGSFTGTYSISGNGSTSKTVTVTFRNFNTDNGDSATKSVSFTVTVPAWTSYTVAYNANGGSGAPGSQTKWKDHTLTLSSTKPTRTGYTFQGWATSASGSVAYAAGGSYSANASVTLYAVWKANTYSVKYNANGGTGAPANQTKTYGQNLTLSSTTPTRTNYNFLGWSTSASATSATYAAGGTYTANSAVTLYAVWSLAYVKPRISNVSVVRCDSTGTETDNGTYAHLSFSWACDKTVSEIKVEWESETSGLSSEVISATGTSGTVSHIFGNDSLSSDSTYTIRVFVTDSGGYTKSVVILAGTVFLIDFLAGGKGVSIGKPAELENTFDVAFLIKPSGGFINISLETDTDLNTVMTPNTYVSINKAASTYKNIPSGVVGTFVLEVLSAGAEGQVFQRLTTTAKATHDVYERHYYQSSWGDWVKVHEDSGWLDLTLASGMAVGSEYGYFKARRLNGVLYLKGDITGVTAAWAHVATLPSSLITSDLGLRRFGVVYDMSHFCGATITAAGKVHVTGNTVGTWTSTKNISFDVAVGI